MYGAIQYERGAKSARARLRGTVWEHSGIAHFCYRALLSLGRGLGRAGVTPNFLTYSSLLLAAGAGLCAAFSEFAWAALFLLLSGICDALDGVVARSTGNVTPYGALLDSTVDRLADGLPLLGLIVAFAKQPWLAALPAMALLGGFAVPYVRARAEALGVRLPPLFMRRAERILLLLLSLVLGELPFGLIVQAPLLLAGVTLMGVLSFVGAFWALREARRALESTTPRELERGADRVSSAEPTPSRP
jgi:CDP-diacylglycerol--glycerol-3-phosphate 3-phosphatidyltransferase